MPSLEEIVARIKRENPGISDGDARESAETQLDAAEYDDWAGASPLSNAEVDRGRSVTRPRPAQRRAPARPQRTNADLLPDYAARQGMPSVQPTPQAPPLLPTELQQTPARTSAPVAPATQLQQPTVPPPVSTSELDPPSQVSPETGGALSTPTQGFGAMSGSGGTPIDAREKDLLSALALAQRSADERSQRIQRLLAISQGVSQIANAQGANVQALTPASFVDPNVPVQRAEQGLGMLRQQQGMEAEQAQQMAQQAWRQQQAEQRQENFQSSLAERRRSTDASLGMQAEMMGLREAQADLAARGATAAGEGSQDAQRVLRSLRDQLPPGHRLREGLTDDAIGSMSEDIANANAEDVRGVLARRGGGGGGGGGASRTSPGSPERLAEVEEFLETAVGRRAIDNPETEGFEGTYANREQAIRYYSSLPTKDWSKIRLDLGRMPVSVEGRGQGAGASAEGQQAGRTGREVVPGLTSSISLPDSRANKLAEGLQASREFQLTLNALRQHYSSYDAAVAINPAEAARWRARVLADVRVLAGKISRMNESGVINQAELPGILQSLATSYDESTAEDVWNLLVTGRGTAALDEWSQITRSQVRARAETNGLDPAAADRWLRTGRAAAGGGGGGNFVILSHPDGRRGRVERGSDLETRLRAQGWR